MIQSGAWSTRSLNRAPSWLSIIWIRRLRRGVELGEPAVPVVVERGAGRVDRGSLGRSRVAPLGTGRPNSAAGLIRLGMDILGEGSAGLAGSATLAAAQQLEASLDMDIAGIELGSALIRIQGIIDLIVA